MALTIGKRTEEGVAILELEGSLSLGPSLVSLRNAAREVLTTPQLGGLILDVHRITSVDSSGLGELTIVYSSTSRRGCRMMLVGVSPSLHKMLQMTHLDAVLQSAADIPAAKKRIKDS